MPLQSALPAISPGALPAPLPVVPFGKLIPFLPEPMEGWMAEIPDGSTTEGDATRISTAQRDYHKGDDENALTASVTIIDSASNPAYLDATLAGWKFNSETAEGFDKGVEIDGMRGFEHYSKASKTSSLSVFVGKRYLVEIELTNQDPRELREWFKRIDVKKLAGLK